MFVTGPNLIQNATTVSTTTAYPELPAANLTTDLYEPWRGPGLSQQLYVEFPNDELIGFIGLLNTNASQAATWAANGYGAAHEITDFSDLTADGSHTGEIAFFPDRIQCTRFTGAIRFPDLEPSPHGYGVRYAADSLLGHVGYQLNANEWLESFSGHIALNSFTGNITQAVVRERVAVFAWRPMLGPLGMWRADQAARAQPWNRLLTPAQLRELPRHAFLTIPEPQPIEAIHITMQDSSAHNPDGYLQAGQLFASYLWRPSHGIKYPVSFGIDDPSETVDLPSGIRAVIQDRSPVRVASVGINPAGANEVYQNQLDIDMRIRSTQMCFVSLYPDTPNEGVRAFTSFPGTLESLSPSSLEFFDGCSKGYKFREVRVDL